MMAARTVQGYPGGKLIRSKTKLTSTPSSNPTASQSKPQPAFAGKGKMLSEASELQSSSNSLKKRKRPSGSVPAPPDKVHVVDLTRDDSEADRDLATTPKKKKMKAPSKGQSEEKRLRVFRKKAPLSYLEKLERATGQRYPPL